MTLLLLAGLALGAGRFEASSPRLRRDRVVDVEKITLNIAPDLGNRSFEATVTHRFKVLAPKLETLELDAAGLEILEASTKFTHKNDKLTLTLGAPLREGEEGEVRVKYRSTQPHLGLHFFKKDPAYPGQPDLVWSKGETERTRHWIPLYDYPNERVQSEVIVKVPAGFAAISNGKLLERGETWRWLQERPHAPYLITLAVGRFDEVKLAENMTVWAPEGRGKDVPRTYGKTPAMAAYFEELTGVKYPWAKYDQVLLYGFRWGGMEDTSAVMLTDRALLDERAALDEDWDGLISHELAHQWFGDLTTCKDWSHMWLNEGFADYFAALWTRRDKGEEEFELEMDGSAEWFFGGSRVPVVTDRYEESDDMFNANSYGKGAWILHRLRAELGEELFWKSIRLYLSRVADHPAETEDLRQAVEDATGRTMEAFFRRWLYEPGHPKLKLTARFEDGKLTLSAKQGGKPYDLKTALEVDGKRFELRLARSEDSWSWPLPARPKSLRFDPDYTIPAEYDLDWPEDWLLALLKDRSAAQRLRAVRALSGRRKPGVKAALRDCALKDPFWGVAAACAEALELPDLLAVVDTPHPKARKAVAQALGRFAGRPETLPALTKLSQDRALGAASAALHALGASRLPEAKPLLEKRLGEDSHNDMVRKAALSGLGALRDESVRPTLEVWASTGHAVSARVSALAALASLGGSRELLERVLRQDEDRMIRQAAAQALAANGDPDAVDALLALQVRERDPRIRIRALEAGASNLAKMKRGKLPDLLKRVERLRRRIAELER